MCAWSHRTLRVDWVVPIRFGDQGECPLEFTEEMTKQVEELANGRWKILGTYQSRSSTSSHHPTVKEVQDMKSVRLKGASCVFVSTGKAN